MYRTKDQVAQAIIAEGRRQGVSPREVWLPVPGYEGHYEASNQGRVRSVNRTLTSKNGLVRRHKGVMLTVCFRADGYPYVGLHRDGRLRPTLLHRIVIETFKGPAPAEGMECCHNDGDRSNARLDNLRWDTRSANHLDKRKHGTDPRANRDHCPRGHVLRVPNLTIGRWETLGHRVCRSCSAARAWVHRHPDDNFETRADSYYEKYSAAS